MFSRLDSIQTLISGTQIYLATGEEEEGCSWNAAPPRCNNKGYPSEYTMPVSLSAGADPRSGLAESTLRDHTPQTEPRLHFYPSSFRPLRSLRRGTRRKSGPSERDGAALTVFCFAWIEKDSSPRAGPLACVACRAIRPAETRTSGRILNRLVTFHSTSSTKALWQVH